MKIVTVIGARPQFIKAAVVSRSIAEHNCLAPCALRLTEFIIHTGQHYDYEMSRVFFEELNIPEPDVNLGVGSGSHGWQTGQMLIRIEEVLLAEKPDWVLVYGDTNSTLAGALAATKLHIPIAHVEAGLRSYNRKMPEEHNRLLTDHCSSILFCPTQTAVNNLVREGITRGVHLVGDTMFDAVLQFAEIARNRSTILKDLGIEPKGYFLATVHRPNNTDVPENLCSILSAFLEIGDPIVFPVHPRTRQKIAELDGMLNLELSSSNMRMINPVGYLDMLILEQNARLILTDSGGIQKEAYFFRVPCITLRSETEWMETVESGWNALVGTDFDCIISAVRETKLKQESRYAYGNGTAAQQIVQFFSSI